MMPGGGRRGNWNIGPAREAQDAAYDGRLEDFLMLVRERETRPAIAQRMGVTQRTVDRWYSEARRRGLLPNR